MMKQEGPCRVILITTISRNQHPTSDERREFSRSQPRMEQRKKYRGQVEVRGKLTFRAQAISIANDDISIGIPKQADVGKT